MTTLIKVKNKDEYLKSIDTRNGKIEYTNDKSQAKVYSDMWFSDTDIDFIKFHFKDDKRSKELVSYCTYLSTP